MDLGEHTERPQPPAWEPEPTSVLLRPALAVGLSTLAAAVMIGGIFRGPSPRVWAGIAGILGIALAMVVVRLRNPAWVNVATAVGILAIGVILTIPAGDLSDVLNLGPFVRDAVASGDIIRPPAPFTLGWRAIMGWLMGGMGFSAAWVAFYFRRTSLGLLLPLPLVAVGAISVPEDVKLFTGLASFILFAIGLGVLAGIDAAEDVEDRSAMFELRRAGRALPMIAIITLLVYAGSRTDIFFPKPRFDPTLEAQRPKTTPITDVPDRVLFKVRSSVTGVWRMGGLDVYKDGQWLLPPFAENRISEVPRSGIVDSELSPGVVARFEIGDLGGAVLPGLSNIVAIVADGPKLAYDSRTGNIRVAEGAVQEGLSYSVTAARLPPVEELRNVIGLPPAEVERFLEIPPPPPAVRDLLARAPTTSPWDRLDFVRLELLKSVVAQGAGTPVPISPQKVDDMLVGSKKGSPFEIVAGQAMLARWAGVPSRIGYGFDGGEKVGEILEVRPRHGASFMEVYFPGHKWLPVLGQPLQAASTIGGRFSQANEDVLASDEIGSKVIVPYQLDPQTYVFQQIRQALLITVPIVLFLLSLYLAWPMVRKGLLRGRRRAWARRKGPYARVALAYAEWRDLITDFGYRHPSDPPLMFLRRVAIDREHTQLAWLVTRSLWGDLQDRLTDSEATAAEEMSRSLRKRLVGAHPWTLRVIAAMSRLSLRNPYAPKLESSELLERQKAA